MVDLKIIPVYETLTFPPPALYFGFFCQPIGNSHTSLGTFTKYENVWDLVRSWLRLLALKLRLFSMLLARLLNNAALFLSTSNMAFVRASSSSRWASIRFLSSSASLKRVLYILYTKNT